MQGVSHLLSNMNKYCNPTEQMYELPEDTFHDDIILHESLDYSELNYASHKYSHNLEAGGSAAESSFHMLDGKWRNDIIFFLYLSLHR